MKCESSWSWKSTTSWAGSFWGGNFYPRACGRNTPSTTSKSLVPGKSSRGGNTAFVLSLCLSLYVVYSICPSPPPMWLANWVKSDNDECCVLNLNICQLLASEKKKKKKPRAQCEIDAHGLVMLTVFLNTQHSKKKNAGNSGKNALMDKQP